MNPVARDEREQTVDQAADRLSYLVLAFGVLAVVAYRGLVLDQASWELLALIVGAGIVGAGYRVWKGTSSRAWALALVATSVVGVVTAAILAIAGAR